jgi:hypothetical protein
MRTRPGKDVRDNNALARLVEENRIEEARVKARQILERQANLDAARKQQSQG